MKKVSFLIPAHNEEKIIEKALKHLSNLPYKNYEVIIGLDGCDDGTLEIVKRFELKSKRFKHYNLDIRKGKPAVINKIIKYARGEIIIINDADWLITFDKKETFLSLVRVFDDKTIGGFAESFPVEWHEIEKGNFFYKMVAYSHYLWMESLKDKFTESRGMYLEVKNPSMFLTNIFRKKLYKENLSLGDDFERTRDIFNSKHKILLFRDKEYPRMTPIYREIKLMDFMRQKIRTAIARRQLTKKGEDVGEYSSYSVLYMLKKSFKLGFKAFYVYTWIFLTAFATLISFFIKKNTSEGWGLRAKR